MTSHRDLLALTSAVVLASVLLAHPSASEHTSIWSEPTNLGPVINSAFSEAGPTLSKDRLSLYFSSNRPCGDGDSVLDLNIWVSHRLADDQPWEPPECLEINVDGFEDSAATFSRDGHWMFFVSNRPGSLGPAGGLGRDIWVSWRAHVHDDHGWTSPFNAGPDINSAVADAGPSYLEGDDGAPSQLFFTSNRSGAFDIYVADVLGDGVLGAATRVDEVSSDGVVQARPSVRYDGRELFWFAGVGTGPYDIFTATRPSVWAPWSSPVNLGAPVNTAASEQQPGISPDGRQLFFASDRTDGYGSLDLWVAQRTIAK
jgi:hypothetical protein